MKGERGRRVSIKIGAFCFVFRHGWEDGRECLLKTICELAETPFGRTRRDVLEEVIHLILT